jgi:hypothetical protein
MRGLRSASVALASGVAAVLMASQPAHAGPFKLGDALFGHLRPAPQRANTPPIGLYRDDADGDPAFVLDRSSSITLLRFEDSPEIWLLTAQPAPRGDTIYKNDVGEPMLRVTRLGGLTLFTLTHPSGAPAALVGDAPAIHPMAVLNQGALLQRLAQASAHASHALQRLVVFEARDPTPQSASLIADAASITAEAVAAIAHRDGGKRVLAKLVRVLLTPGHKASVGLANGVLQVVVAPRPGVPFADLAGRPSSRRVELALDQ